MVTSRLDRLRFAALTAALACSGAWAAPPATSLRERDITLDAASSELDYRDRTVLFRDAIISQGSIKVSAENARATGLEFEDATWNFDGRVKIEFESGMLRSDSAAIVFQRNRITRVDIRGKQAEFEQALAERSATARGRATEISYDVTAGTVVLSGAAWLSDGRSEIRGEQLVYNVRERRVQAGKPVGQDERVRITIRPKADTP